MVRSTEFGELPPSVLERVAEVAGKVVEFIPAEFGNHADVAGELRTSGGRVFVKGARLVPDQTGGGAEAWSLRNESAILPSVRPYAPELYWQVETDGWYLVGFEFINGRHADYTPNSPDMEPVGAVVEHLSKSECPPAVRLRVEDRYSALDARASVFAGPGLLHCDLNPTNVLIGTDGSARVVDWAFCSRGASWLELAFLVPWLLREGHTPETAESWLSQFPLWKAADPWHVDLFVSLLDRAWTRRNVEGAPAWISEYSGLVQAWNLSRG
ncbi:MAG: phosphotransferase [Catenulisporales bacterium]|nr:phosphotransferase [Catenulisporales bacterium]